jgi:hypothetical protein
MAVLAVPVELLPRVVMMMGRMLRPNELSMPFSPSTWAYVLAPAVSVHTSVEQLVVDLPSRFRPNPCQAYGSLAPFRSVSP